MAVVREWLLESVLVRLDVEGGRGSYVYGKVCADVVRTRCSDGETMGGVIM